MENKFEKNINGIELPESLKKRLGLWEEYITIAKIPQETKASFLEVLHNFATNFLPNQRIDSVRGLLFGWSAILEKKDPNILRRDGELKRHALYGKIGSIKLSDEDDALLMLYRELRQDVSDWLVEPLE